MVEQLMRVRPSRVPLQEQIYVKKGGDLQMETDKYIRYNRVKKNISEKDIDTITFEINKICLLYTSDAADE